MGHLIIWSSLPIFLIMSGILINNGFERTTFITFLIVLFIIGSFASLEVSIDQEYLRLKFGYGIYRRKFKLTDISSAKIVKNHWYYGWGIRYWIWRPMWIYNVSGFDAIEIQTKDGKRHRIGTDEPEKLEDTLKNQLKK